MKRFCIIVFCLLTIMAGCSKNKTTLTTEQKLANADALFARKKYSRAAQLYEDITFERKSASTAHALMRQAESYFAINKFTDAQLKFRQFIEMFPDHNEVNKAYYLVGVSLYESSMPAHYDQTETLQAIDAFKLFVEKFPSDERYQNAVEYIRKGQYKLLQKKLNNGYIYYKMKDYSGALMYLKEITELGNSDSLDRKALFYSTLIHLKQGNKELAAESFSNLKSKYPGSKETKKLKKKI